MPEFSPGRSMLRSRFPETRESLTDQRKGLPQPPLEKPLPVGSIVIDLPDPALACPPQTDLFSLLRDRQSRREYSPERLTLEELSFLLWATQGVKSIVRDGFATLRTVPSGGSRHPFETYLAVNRVEGLEPGIYRYMAIGHKLTHLTSPTDLPSRIEAACGGQGFVGSAAVVFFWSSTPYRCEWRYSVAAHKTVAQDSGHVCQNLYIACEALGLATVAIGAYDQTKADALLELDGEDELVTYVAPVGKRRG